MPACPERGGKVALRVLNDTLLRLYSGRANKIKQAQFIVKTNNNYIVG